MHGACAAALPFLSVCVCAVSSVVVVALNLEAQYSVHGISQLHARHSLYARTLGLRASQNMLLFFDKKTLLHTLSSLLQKN